MIDATVASDHLVGGAAVDDSAVKIAADDMHERPPVLKYFALPTS